MKTHIPTIQKHEATLNKAEQLQRQLQSLLNEWEALHPDFQALMAYYGSPQWQHDVEASNNGELTDIEHGVLSEDAVFNLYAELRQVNFKMIRCALNYIED